LAKIAENCDHNIDPWSRTHDLLIIVPSKNFISKNFFRSFLQAYQRQQPTCLTCARTATSPSIQGVYLFLKVFLSFPSHWGVFISFFTLKLQNAILQLPKCWWLVVFFLTWVSRHNLCGL
jgi:hypothetical protein